MSFWNIADGISAPLLNGQPSGIDNDHGNIKYAGKIIETQRFSAEPFYTTPPVTLDQNVTGMYVPLSGGVWNDGDYVLRRFTNDIASIANTSLLTGGSDSANKTPRVKSVTDRNVELYATAVRNNGWHEVSGIFSPALQVVHSGVWDQTLDADTATNPRASGTDHAAEITKTRPGEFVVFQGGTQPQQNDYKPRTLF